MRPVIDETHRLPRGGDFCDFCGSPHVTGLHPCKNFPYAGRPVFSKPVGYWAACAVCELMIRKHAWAALTDRVMDLVANRAGVTELGLPALRRGLARLHRQFVRKRIAGAELPVIRPRKAKGATA